MRKSAVILSLILSLSLILTSCQKNGEEDTNNNSDTLKVAVLEAAYGSEVWEKICREFEKQNGDVEVILTAEKNLEDVIGSQMKGGSYPDVIHLATGREMALTETLIRENGIHSLENVLKMTVPGEDEKVSDKILSGFTDTLATNPYSDNKTYLAPMFYSPCGLFYNEDLLSDYGWEMPETWDEMWELGDKAKTEGIYLFTYPTVGYFDSFIYTLIASSGGIDFFNDVMSYKEGVWETEAADRVLKTVEKLRDYTHPTTVANATPDNFLKNQQLVLDGEAIFMPNGTWVVGEMADAPRREGFKWGFSALPAATDESERFSYTYIEQCWIPKEAKNKDMAEKFVAFLFSDKAAEIFMEYGAIQPIKDINEKITGENELFYSIYDDGTKAVMGSFAATEAVSGVSMYDSLIDSINSVISGDETVEEWKEDIIKTSNKLRESLK